MSAIATNLPLVMTRPTLDGLPEFPLPRGFAVRWFQPGDQAHWLRIHQLADPWNTITPELFEQQFGSDTVELARRQCYLVSPQDAVVGTASAWFSDTFQGGGWGRVHWVAILPEYQGRGLGKVLLSVVCQRLRELGHRRAYLTTSSARLAAIGLYLKFGFEPLIRDAAEATCWQEVFERLRR